MPKKTERGAVATSHNNATRNNTLTQEEIVLGYLEKHGSITSQDAWRMYSITRLSGRIFNLRKAGYNIETVYETSQYGSRYGRYVLHEEDVA